MTDRTLALVPLATVVVVLGPVLYVGLPSTPVGTMAAVLLAALSALLVGAYVVARRVDPEAGDPEVLERRIARSRDEGEEYDSAWD